MTRLLVCSHRGPTFSNSGGPAGFTAQAPPGGLVPVVSSVLNAYGGRWVYAASSPEQLAQAHAHPRGRVSGDVTLQMLALPEEMHREHYAISCVEYLAPLFHYLFALAYEPVFDARLTSAWKSYCAVNDVFARAALDGCDDADVVLVEDHHLALVGASLRQARKGSVPPLLYFHHLPWCEPDYFTTLPSGMRDSLLQSLLAYDSVGFHCTRWTTAFLRCCERFVPGALVDESSVTWHEHCVAVTSAPAPVDPSLLANPNQSLNERHWAEQIRQHIDGRFVLARVDRVDLWKNVLRGFLAWELFLERTPSAADEAVFLAILTATRTWLPQYRQYLNDCLAVVDRINDRFGRPGHAVIHALVNNDGSTLDRDRSLAAMRLADAMLVNPLYDGLNLVAKEAAAISERDASIILSRNAGVFEELGDLTLPIDPVDIDETAFAIERAQTMSAEERRTRATSMRRVIGANTPRTWITRRLRNIQVRKPDQ